MFESAFNLKFNLHKAYTDIGISDEDAERLACVYGIDPEEIGGILEGFAQENQKNAKSIVQKHGLLGVSPNIKKKIAYIGDSITSDRNSHQRIMQCILEPWTGIEMRDFAISGWKVSDVLTAYFPGIDAFAPDIAVMMIGTNDMRMTDDEFAYNHTSVGEFERDLDYVVKKLVKSGCRVILCTLPPFCMKKMTPSLPDWKILYTPEGRGIYDKVIIRTAKDNGCLLADMREKYDAFDPADITIEDGLHLNAAGQTLLAGEIYGILKKLLALEA
jgi:lysophospholipase L1-like esterase